MGDSLPWLAAHLWKGQVSFAGQWERMTPEQRDRVLEFWLRLSETDKWTRQQLRQLFMSCMDAGDIPEALQAWANKDYTGSLKPIRTGPRTDHASDYRITAMVETRKLVHKEKDHAARRAVAEELNPKHPQYDKVRGAHERGSRLLTGLWPNFE